MHLRHYLHPQPVFPHAEPVFPYSGPVFPHSRPIVRQPDGRRAVIPEFGLAEQARGFRGPLSAGAGRALRRRRPFTGGKREPVSLRDRY